MFTDDAAVYTGIPRSHSFVKDSVRKYVEGQVHTNGIEPFWSMFKRSYMGTYHKMSPKHLDRYVGEFASRHNDRPFDTATQIENPNRESGWWISLGGGTLLLVH